MARKSIRAKGFTLVELLLVLAVLAIISAISIPALNGQRQRAKRIGDAESTARVLAMGMEARRAENGVYGAANDTAVWRGSAAPTLTGFTTNPVPTFSPGSSALTYRVTVNTPLTFTIDVFDGGTSGTRIIAIDQAGRRTVYQK